MSHAPKQDTYRFKRSAPRRLIVLDAIPSECGQYTDFMPRVLYPHDFGQYLAGNKWIPMWRMRLRFPERYNRCQ